MKFSLGYDSDLGLFLASLPDRRIREVASLIVRPLYRGFGTMVSVHSSTSACRSDSGKQTGGDFVLTDFVDLLIR